MQEGDTLEVDIPKGLFQLHVSDEELSNRRAQLPPFVLESEDYPGRYSTLVQLADTGAVFSSKPSSTLSYFCKSFASEKFCSVPESNSPIDKAIFLP